MAALIKRILRNNRSKRHPGWASREEREQFKLQREQWRNKLTNFMML